MASPYIQQARGIRKSSPIITIAAPNVAENLYLVSAGGTVARTVIIRKITGYSALGAAIVLIGVGLAPLVPIIVPHQLLNLTDSEWPEDIIPEVEVNANITVQSTVAGVMIQIEVEEIGS